MILFYIHSPPIHIVAVTDAMPACAEHQVKEKSGRMKNILVGCLMLLGANILSAQQFSITFTMKTPFVVGEGTLPAGNYVIRSLDDEDSTFECAAASGAPSVMFEADAHETVPTTTGVTFQKYNNKLILKNMSIAGQQGFFIPISLTEKHTKKTGGKPTKVTQPATKPS
jgi:hypothetical protein